MTERDVAVHDESRRTETLIRRFYALFNERKLEEAATLLAPDARLEQTTLGSEAGSDGYHAFARRWLAAFPDGQLTIERIDHPRDTWYEVHLIGEGTHAGEFEMGAIGAFPATHRPARLRFRDLLQISNGHITSSTLSFDTQELIRQLVEPT